MTDQQPCMKTRSSKAHILSEQPDAKKDPDTPSPTSSILIYDTRNAVPSRRRFLTCPAGQQDGIALRTHGGSPVGNPRED
jgi:hypothetical protein